MYIGSSVFRNIAWHTSPDPLKDPQNGTPQNDPRATLGKLGDYWEVPFVGSFSGSGLCTHQSAVENSRPMEDPAPQRSL